MMPERPSNEHIVNEKVRKYKWLALSGSTDSTFWTEYHDVVGVRVSQSGNHYLRQKGGHLAIVAPGWIAVEIELEDPEAGWTF